MATTLDDIITKATESQVVELNGLHAVVVHRGNTFIMTKKADGSTDFGTVSDLHTRYENQRAPIPGTKTEGPISKLWLRSKNRRTYPEGVVFDPGNDNMEEELIGYSDSYNLWRGFPKLQKIEGATCELFLEHTRKIICDGNAANFDWLMKWLAHLIQHPEVKPGTSVILKGTFGAGKDTWGGYVGKMLGRHHVPISQPEHLTGHFNAHLETALLLHVEEGYWAGDRKAEGVLKSLITGEDIMIERKGIDPISIANFMRILFTSNKNWVVPAVVKERRFFVLDVSDAKAKERTYFEELVKERDEGGAAALFEHLKKIDLTGFDVRNPPVTAGLVEQIHAGLKNIESWWRDILDEGELPVHGFKNGEWERGSVEVERAALRSAYEHWMERKRFDGDTLGPEEFGKRLRKLVPGLQERRPRIGGSPTCTYLIPSLAACREAFEAQFGVRGGTEVDGSDLI